MSLDAFKTLAAALQALVTALGLVAAGLWTYLLFVRRRQRYPRAELHHDVSVLDLSPDRTLVHVKATLKNIGDVLIRVIFAKVHVGRVLPLEEGVAARLQAEEDLVLANESDIKWSTLGQRDCSWQQEPCEIEPGETDDFHFDFVVPAEVKVLEVHAYLKNEAKRDRAIGWRHTSFVQLEMERAKLRPREGDQQDG